MKLLELTRSYYPSVGGFEKSIFDKTKIYDALGIDYTIVTTDFYEHLSGNERLPNVVYLKQYTPYNITPLLFKHLHSKYDIVNINTIGRFYSDFAINHYSGSRTKIVLTPHSVYHSSKYKPIKRIMQKKIIPFLLKKVDMLVALTEYEKMIWVSEYGVSSDHVTVIPHYISAPAHPIVEATANEKYFLYLGRNDKNKKPELLLKSYLQLHDTNFFLHMTLTPDDIDSRLYNVVKNNPRIKLLGFVNEAKKQELLQQAEAVVLPTTWEAFGYVAFEASQYSKPLLCSSLPVFHELLDGRGVIFFENNELSLTKALQTFLMLSSEKKKTMGIANHQNLSNYTFEQSKAKYQALFERLLTNR